MSSMRIDVPANIKETLFRMQLDKSKSLHDEMAYYHRQRPGHADRSYRYLAECVRRWIERRRLGSNRRLVARALGGSRSLYPAVPAAGTGPSSSAGPRPRSASKSSRKGRSKSPTKGPKGRGVCYAFRREGRCEKGNDCRFKHVSGSNSPSSSSRGRSLSRRSSNRGNSRSKSSRPRKHSTFRSSSSRKGYVCRFHQTGERKFGSK